MDKLTTTEAAALLGVNPSTVRRLIASKQMRAQKLGPFHMIERREVERVRGVLQQRTGRGWPAGKKRKQA